jgi:hypothetical protein
LLLLLSQVREQEIKNKGAVSHIQKKQSLLARIRTEVGG